MKKIFSVLLLFIVCLSGFAQNSDFYSAGKRSAANPHVSKFDVTQENIDYVLSTPYVDTSFKIYDYAGIFSKQQRREIQNRCQEFINKTELGIAIVTINGTDHRTFDNFNPQESFIHDFYDYNDFRPDGVMLLLNLDPGVSAHHSLFDAGQLYYRYFMTSKLQRYGPQMKALYNNGDYYNDVMFFIENVEEDYLYGISDEEHSSSQPDKEIEEYYRYRIIGDSIFVLLFAFLFWGIHRSKYKLKFKATSANNYKKKGSFALTQNRTDFVRSFTTSTYSPRNKGGSGGGRSSSGGGHSGGSF